MKIVNARIFTGGKFIKGLVEFNNRIVKIIPEEDLTVSEVNAFECENDGTKCTDENDKIVDAHGLMLIPGLIDIHTHGAVGVDVDNINDGDLLKLTSYYAQNAVTSFCPTFATTSVDRYEDSSRKIADYIKSEKEAVGSSYSSMVSHPRAKIAGINLEGPFVSPNMLGSQNPAHQCNPDIDILMKINEASSGLVRLVTVAPELNGADDFIDKVSKLMTVSVGHTQADYDTVARSFELGAKSVTHLFNRMKPINHREPGPIVAAALKGDVTAELITDGHHVHPAMVQLAFKLLPGRICIVSDSLLCAGMPDGDYDFAGTKVTKTDGAIFIKDSDFLAGSSISLIEGVKRAVKYGVSVEEAITAATITPAKIIRQDDEIGSIDVGKKADFVLIDDDFDIKSVYIDGENEAK